MDMFNLKEGVKLTANGVVLKNNDKLDNFIDENGRQRMSKLYFEKKVKGRIDIKNKGISSENDDGKKMEVLEQLQKDEQSEIETLKRVESLTSQASINAKSAKDVKIFFKNYTSFIQGVSESQKLPKISDLNFSSKKRRGSAHVSQRQDSKDLFKEERDRAKVAQANERYRQRNKFLNVENKPMDVNHTYKNLKKLQRSTEPQKQRLREINDMSLARIRERSLKPIASSLNPVKINNRSFSINDRLKDFKVH